MFQKLVSFFTNSNETESEEIFLSIRPNGNVFKEILSKEEILTIAQFLPIRDLNSFAQSDEFLLEMMFDLTIEKVEAISKRKQELKHLDLESRIVSIKDQYKDNETSLAQQFIWKPLVLLYFPNYSANLNVKNWMHIMRRRILHLKNKFPNELPLSKIIPAQNGIRWSKFRKNRDRHFIENCDWEYECPLKNSVLTKVSNGVFYCNVCKENVYEVLKNEDFEQHVRDGHCVAFSKYLVPENENPLVKGKVSFSFVA